MTRLSRLVLVVLVFIASIGTLLPPARAQDAGPSAAQQLADRYVPVAYLRTQDRACALPPGGGEPYLPLPVEIVLDNERVLIRDSATDQVLGTGPDAVELATYGPDTYMDFPGDPRRPGCTYENDERLRIEELGLEPTTYARVVVDEDGQRLALQYWFYWYFNDWNNTHESDWEMIQVFWDDVASAEEALQTSPDRVGYSQHGNGEMADWGDDKLQLEDGTHPLVYPAAGSHATFFSNDTFLAWGERNSGFGCDVSSGPSTRVPLIAVLVPDEIDPDGEWAWLLYEGRWGERQPASFNGPVGMNLNARWIDPWQAAEDWRPFSIVVPASDALGPTMTEAFCSLTESGSRLLILALVYPWITLPTVALAFGVFLWFTRRSWPIFRQAFRLYRDHWRLFTGIGLVAIPIGIVFNVLQAFLIDRQPLRFIIDWFDETAGARLTAVSLVGSIQQLAMLLVIAPAVVQAVADITRGQQPDVLRSYRLASGRTPAIALAFLVFVILTGIPLATAIGIPIALWLAIRWHFFMQVLVFDGQVSSADSLRVSHTLVSGRWWKTFFAVLAFDLLATIPGIAVGFGLLTLGRTAVGFANATSSILYALTIPISVIAVTLLYLQLVERSSPTELARLTAPTGDIPEPQPPDAGTAIAPST
ncbi:MAG TPA: hypothetical protein VKZ61_00930 [Thermomicrobiales bacterium]|nr:hypothetical protein [Thermomicrobiales bacterium]